MLVAVGFLLVLHSQSSRDTWHYIARINPTLREWVARLLSSPAPRSVADKWDKILVLAGALLVGSFILTYKLWAYFGLGTTSDIYSDAQLATSWLGGPFLHDNYFGNVLSTHTYLFLPLLAVFVAPLGPMGLLVALSLSAAAGFVAGFKILRLLGVHKTAAWTVAMVLFAAPLSFHFYADDPYGFHVELLAPPMLLWLVYFALKRSWLGTMLMTVAVISIKEDAPLIVAVACAMIVAEDLVRSFGSRERPVSPVNWQALTSMLCALAAVPALLFVLKLNPAKGFSPGSFARLKPLGNSEVSGISTLLDYLSANLGTWLSSYQVASWRSLVLPATFGLVILRPHLVLMGAPLTVVSWLMQDDPLWPPRIYGSFAFLQVVLLLGFSTAWALFEFAMKKGSGGRVAAVILLAALSTGVGYGYRLQFSTVPDAGEVYRMSPKVHYSPEDRARADALYSIYIRERHAGEPVAASPYLFRYASYRDLYWIYRQTVEPVWILADEPYQADASKYALRGRDGRFYLYRKK